MGFIRLNEQGLKVFYQGNPWLYWGSVAEAEAEEGALVRILDPKDKLIGWALYQGESSGLSAVVLSKEPASPNENEWRTRLQICWEYRQQLPITQWTNAYRVVFAEADNLPGLIIDHYNDTAVVQFHLKGLQNLLLSPLTSFLKEKGIKNLIWKQETTTEILFGKLQNPTFYEKDLSFVADIQQGQKTGFYLDQRYNRLLLRSWVKDKVVLNLFSYTGAFSLHALKAGAKKVISVDSSQRALTLLEEQLKINHLDKSRHESVQSKVFPFLQSCDETFDVIIVDPPAFTKHRSTVPQAQHAYKKLNRLALERLKKGGIMMTFSCSRPITLEIFQQLLKEASRQGRHSIQILQWLQQDVDHPIVFHFPPSFYLKGALLRKV